MEVRVIARVVSSPSSMTSIYISYISWGFLLVMKMKTYFFLIVYPEISVPSDDTMVESPRHKLSVSLSKTI